MSSSLKSKILNSSLWSFAGSSSHQIFGFLVFIFVSRILTPSEVGIAALGMVIAETITLITTFGMIAVIVREKELLPKTLSTILFTNLFLGVIFGITLFFSANLIEDLLQVKSIGLMVKYIAFVPLINALGVIPEGLCQRNHDFKTLALRTFTSTLIGGIVAIFLVIKGYGALSLIVQFIVSSLIRIVILWIYCKWRISLRFSWMEFKRIFNYGFSIMSSLFMERSIYKIRDIIIARFLGEAALGYLYIVYKLNDLIVKFFIYPLTGITLTTLSPMQNDLPKLANTYINLLHICCLIALPAYAGLAVIAPNLIPLAFGEQWSESITLTQIVSLSALFAIINFFFTPMISALGRIKVIFGVSVFKLILIIPITIIAARYGLESVVIGFASYLGVSSCVCLYFTWKELKTSTFYIISLLIRPVVASILMAISLYFLKNILSNYGDAITIIAIIPMGAALYPLFLFCLFPRYTIGLKNSLLSKN